MISNLSFVHPSAVLGANVTVEPFAYIGERVEIGDGSWIGPHATVLEGSFIGKNCKIFPGAVIGAVPQDLKYKGENKAKSLLYDTVSLSILLGYIHQDYAPISASS